MRPRRTTRGDQHGAQAVREGEPDDAAGGEVDDGGESVECSSAANRRMWVTWESWQVRTACGRYRDPATGEARKGAVLTVERPIVQLGGKLRESKAKTRAGWRRVFLDHDTAELVDFLDGRPRLPTTIWCSARTTASPGTRTTCPSGSRSWPHGRGCLHEGGRHTGNSLMQDAGVDQELRMREVGHADKSVNDRYTHPLEQAHLAASEQTAAKSQSAGTTPPQVTPGGAGGARTNDRQIMSTQSCPFMAAVRRICIAASSVNAGHAQSAICASGRAP
jgi:hypothetical protein